MVALAPTLYPFASRQIEFLDRRPGLEITRQHIRRTIQRVSSLVRSDRHAGLWPTRAPTSDGRVSRRARRHRAHRPQRLVTSWSYDSFGRRTLEALPGINGPKAAAAYLYCNAVNGGTAPCPANGAYLVQVTPQSHAGTQNGPVAIAYYDALSRVIATDVEGFDGPSQIGCGSPWISSQQFKTSGFPEYLIVTSKSDYTALASFARKKFSQSKKCSAAEPSTPSWGTVEISQANAGHYRVLCVVPKESACTLLNEFATLRNVDLTAAQQEPLENLAGSLDCAR
jgi:hypothetical protein